MIKTHLPAMAAILLSLTPAWRRRTRATCHRGVRIPACGIRERLACFDQAVTALKSGAETTGVTAENMFGANNVTSLASAEQRDVKREELRQIRGTVTSLRSTDDGMIVVELDNGQVWRQQDSSVHDDDIHG